MSLLDDVAAAKKHHGPRCGIPALLEKQSEPLRTEMAEAIESEDVQARALSRVLRTKYDIDVSDYLIRRHRARECRCR